MVATTVMLNLFDSRNGNDRLHWMPQGQDLLVSQARLLGSDHTTLHLVFPSMRGKTSLHHLKAVIDLRDVGGT